MSREDSFDALRAELLERYSSGDLLKLQNTVSDLISAVDFDNPDNFRKQWADLSAVESRIRQYMFVGRHDSDVDESEELKAAFDVALDINSVIKKKKSYVGSSLDKVLLSSGDLLDKYVSDDGFDYKRFSGQKERLRKASDIAEVIDRGGFVKASDALLRDYSLVIETASERDALAKEARLRVDNVLASYEKSLSQKSSKKELFSFDEELSRIPLQYNLEDEDVAAVENLQSKVQSQLQDVQKRQRKRMLGVLGKVGFGSLVVAGAFVGYTAVTSLSGKLEDRIDAYRDEKAIALLDEELAGIREQKAAVFDSVEVLRDEKSSLEGRIGDLQSQVAKSATQYASAQRNASAGNNKSVSTTRIGQYTFVASEITPQMVVDRFSHVLDDKRHTLYVEKSTNTSYLLSSGGDGTVHLRGTFKHTDAKDPLPKTMEGQDRTPEGVYALTERKLVGESNKSDVYGVGFYRIGFPTAQQKSQGFSGSGILVCSAPDRSIERAISASRDVMRCGVAYSDKDFLAIDRIIGSAKDAQVIIEDYQHRPLEVAR